MDDDSEDLKARIQELEDELQQLKDQKRQDSTDSAAVDEEIEEVHDQIRDEAENSGMSRRKFMKAIAGGGAALGAAAMMPSAAALDIESNNPLSYNSNFEVDTQGNLNLRGKNITNAGSVSIERLATEDREPDIIVREDGAEFVIMSNEDVVARESDGPEAIRTGFGAAPEGGTVLIKGEYTFDSESDVIESSKSLKVLAHGATLISKIGSEIDDRSLAYAPIQFSGEQIGTYDLTQDTSEGDTQLYLDTSDIEKKHLLTVRDDVEAGTGVQSEVVRVKSVETDHVVLYNELEFDYQTAENAEATVYDPLHRPEIHGLTIEGTGRDTKEWGPRISQAFGALITGCEATELGKTGISLEESYQSALLDNTCENIYRGGDGYGLHVLGGSYIIIANNRLTDCRHGVNVTGGDPQTFDVLVEGNTLVDTDITIRNTYRPSITGNKFSGSNIRWRAEDVTITDNTFRRAGTIISDRDQGTSCGHLVIRGNVLHSVGDAPRAIGIRNQDNEYTSIKIEDNTIYAEDAVGIQVQDHPAEHLSIENNHLEYIGDDPNNDNGPNQAILVDSSGETDPLYGKARIRDNTILALGDFAIRYYGNGDENVEIVDNECIDIPAGGGSSAIRVTNCINPQIDGNTIIDEVWDDSYITLRGIEQKGSQATQYLIRRNHIDIGGVPIRVEDWSDGDRDMYAAHDNTGFYRTDSYGGQPLSIEPGNPRPGMKYFDDGTNRSDGNPGDRVWNGSEWVDL